MFIAIEQLEERPVRFHEVFAPGRIDYAMEGLSQAVGLRVRGTASLLNREIHIQGHLETEIEGACARCLEPVRQVVDKDFDLYYHPLSDCPRAEELQVPPGEEELGFYQGEGLLLEDVAKEQVLLTLPMRTICREDCRGLCPRCGVNRNLERCTCVPEPLDPRWEGLRGLK